MSWTPGFPVNFTPSGDSVAESLQKHISEFAEVYSKLCRTRTLDAGTEPPQDAWKGCLWVDTTDPVCPALKVFDGSSWQVAFDIGALTDGIQAAIERIEQAISNVDRAVPPGTIASYVGATPPDGWFECGGQTIDAAQYPKLVAAIGSNVLPQLRGYFVRGWDPDGNIPTEEGRVRGSEQGPCNMYHHHFIRLAPGESGGTLDTGALFANGPVNPSATLFPGKEYRIITDLTYGARTIEHGELRTDYDGWSTKKSGWVYTESRPWNRAFMFIIKHD